MTAANDAGRLIAVCIGPGGIPKHPVESVRVTEQGLVGDAHQFHLHGGKDRAVCLFSVEDYKTLQADQVVAEPPGAFGENLLTEGLDYIGLRCGDRLQIGDEVMLEIHDVREPCDTLKKVDRRFPDLMLGRSGFMCRVVSPGELKPGHSIRRVDPA